MGPPSLPTNHPSNQSFGFSKVKGNDQQPQGFTNRNRANSGNSGQFQQNQFYNQRNQQQNQPRNHQPQQSYNQQQNQQPYQQFVQNMNQGSQPPQQSQFSNPVVDNLFNQQQRSNNKKFAPNFGATTPRTGRKGGRK